MPAHTQAIVQGIKVGSCLLASKYWEYSLILHRYVLCFVCVIANSKAISLVKFYKENLYCNKN